jgi:predicted P-loop ATPase
MDSNFHFGFKHLPDGNILLLGPDGSSICCDETGRILLGSNGQPMTIKQHREKKQQSYSAEETKVPLREYRKLLEELFRPRLNLRTMEIEFSGTEISEEEFESLNVTLVENEGLRFQKGDMQAVVRAIARKAAYDPVHTYLNSLGTVEGPVLTDEEWDQIAVLALNLGDSWSRKVVQKQLLSAVARVFEPGCKVDYCLILHGVQGLGKSSYFRALAGEYFTDSMGGLDNIKDDLMIMHRSWFAEWSEADQVFVGANKAERIKRFVSTQEDAFRIPYGRSTHSFKRRGILCGTTNRDDWANDPSGNRRFPVLSPPSINTEWIEANRDKIWARVMVEYRKGQRWWFTKEEEEIISQKTAEYAPINDECENAWEWLKSHSGEWVSTKDLMIEALGRDPEQIRQKEVSAFSRQMSGLQQRGALKENRNYMPRKALSGTRIRTTCWSFMSV